MMSMHVYVSNSRIGIHWITQQKRFFRCDCVKDFELILFKSTCCTHMREAGKVIFILKGYRMTETEIEAMYCCGILLLSR